MNETVEHTVTADAGIYLSSGERWWGSRIKWRREGERKWRSFVVTDLHPFDYKGIQAALDRALAADADGMALQTIQRQTVAP